MAVNDSQNFVTQVLCYFGHLASLYMQIYTYINELHVDELIHTIVRLLETSKTLMWGQLILEALGSPVSKRCFNQFLHPKFGLGSLRKLQQWLFPDFYIACRDIS